MDQIMAILAAKKWNIDIRDQAICLCHPQSSCISCCCQDLAISSCFYIHITPQKYSFVCWCVIQKMIPYMHIHIMHLYMTLFDPLPPSHPYANQLDFFSATSVPCVISTFCSNPCFRCRSFFEGFSLSNLHLGFSFHPLLAHLSFRLSFGLSFRLRFRLGFPCPLLQNLCYSIMAQFFGQHQGRCTIHHGCVHQGPNFEEVEHRVHLIIQSSSMQGSLPRNGGFFLQIVLRSSNQQFLAGRSDETNRKHRVALHSLLLSGIAQRNIFETRQQINDPQT